MASFHSTVGLYRCMKEQDAYANELNKAYELFSTCKKLSQDTIIELLPKVRK